MGLRTRWSWSRRFGHHGEVGHHVVLAEETAERLHHLGNVGVGRVHQFVELALGLFAPMARVFKGRDLRLALVPLGRLEQEIVVALGIERRVEIDQIHAVIWKRGAVAQHVEVVAKVKPVHQRRLGEGGGGVNFAAVALGTSQRAVPTNLGYSPAMSFFVTRFSLNNRRQNH